MKKIIAIAAVLYAAPANAAGLCWPECVDTLEMSPTEVLVTAQGVGLFSVGQNKNVLVEAARQTLAHGYTHFRLTNPQDYTQYSGGSFNGWRSGGWFGGNMNSTRHGVASAVVVMGDTGLDARAILNREGE
jgi:hypothetical protein